MAELNASKKRAAPEAGASSRRDRIARAMEESGLFSHRSAERESLEAEFVQLAGERSNGLKRGALVSSWALRGVPRGTAEALFDGMDLDGSGVLDWQEYVLGRAAMRLEPQDSTGGPLETIQLQIAFRYFDKDNDGYLSLAEIQDMVSELGKGKAHAKYLMQQLSLDGVPDNAAVSLERFIRTGKATLEQLHLSTRDLFRG